MMETRASRLIFCVLLAFFVPSVRGAVLADFNAAASNDWNSAGKAFTSGDWELWLSGYSYHAPWSYARKYCDDLNSKAWGVGVARSVLDRKGDQHTVYILGFEDSYYHGEFHLGYMWMRSWAISEAGPSLGLGYSAFLFSRCDMKNHMPLPGILPFAALGGEKVKLYFTFIPRVKGFVEGNTAYCFITVKL
jgi:palmitoyl transferase